MTDLTPHQPTQAELEEFWAEERDTTSGVYTAWHRPGNGPLPASQPLRATTATDPAVAPTGRQGFDWANWDGDQA